RRDIEQLPAAGRLPKLREPVFREFLGCEGSGLVLLRRAPTSLVRLGIIVLCLPGPRLPTEARLEEDDVTGHGHQASPPASQRSSQLRRTRISPRRPPIRFIFGASPRRTMRSHVLLEIRSSSQTSFTVRNEACRSLRVAVLIR